MFRAFAEVTFGSSLMSSARLNPSPRWQIPRRVLHLLPPAYGKVLKDSHLKLSYEIIRGNNACRFEYAAAATGNPSSSTDKCPGLLEVRRRSLVTERRLGD